MYAVRKWAVSHAPLFDMIYKALERTLTALDPFLLKIGYDRIEAPITFIEKYTKGFLFDCQMCGQCALHDTGMSCPMNCPKQLRNGPCGGVRPNGQCEVDANMKCVWVEAWRGRELMNTSDSIIEVQLPLDHRLKGRSSWLREVKLKRDKAFFADANND